MQNDAVSSNDDLESTTTFEEDSSETPVQGLSLFRLLVKKLITYKCVFVGFSNKCGGRVEFQIAAVATFPKLNVTNDVQADSPADCARKCLENVSFNSPPYKAFIQLILGRLHNGRICAYHK